MPLDEVVRRNRRRIVLLTLLSTGNLALISGLVAGFFLWVLLDDVSGAVILGAGLALGGGIAVVVVASRLRAVRRRVLGRLGAIPLRPGDEPRIDNLLAGLCIAAGLPRVSAALIADEAPNALAVGRRPSDTTIVVTSGLIERLTRDELEAVLAAELCAVRRLDTAMETATLACAAGAAGFHRFWRGAGRHPRSWPWIAATWPSMALAEVLRRSVLRSGDFGADRMAVAITRNPAALRTALVKLRDDSREALDPKVNRRFRRVRGETAAFWFEPLAESDAGRIRELRWLRSTATLEERLARLPQ